MSKTHADRFASRTKIADGTLNPSKPFPDGRPSSTSHFGTVHVNLAHPEVLAALAAGQTSIALDVKVRSRTRGSDGAQFFAVEAYDLYVADGEDEAATG